MQPKLTMFMDKLMKCTIGMVMNMNAKTERTKILVMKFQTSISQ